MEEFALYLFKSVVWLAGFILVFILFLKNERFFLLNRIYLIAGILTSFIFPLISVHYTVVLPAVSNIRTGSLITGVQVVQHSVIPDIRTILSALYFLGVGFVVLFAVRQGRSIFRAIRKSEVISLSPVKLVKTPEYTSAFSFFSYVFVNPSVTDIEAKEIMIHELVHIRQKHWFDLLLVELLCMIQWFNPLVWLYVRFIRQNHEYLADEVALQQTSDPAIYKAVLLNQIVGAPVISLSNSFSYSPNKKRFYMMKNIITSPYRKMKVLLILPVFAFVLFAFAKPDYKYKYSDQNQGGFVVPDTLKHGKGLPPPPPPPPVPANFDGNGVPPPPPPIPKNHVSKGVPPPPPPLPVPAGHDSLGMAPPPPPPPPLHTSFDNISIPPPHLPAVNPNSDISKALYVLDGTITTEDEVTKINPATIESVNVYSGKYATDKYGDKAKDGVVVIISKIPPKADFRTVNDVKPVIVVDDVIKDIVVNSIDPNTIESISVFKGDRAEEAAALYGAKGKNGLIVIRIKKDVTVNPVISTDFKVVKDYNVEKDVSVKNDVQVKK